MGRILIGLIFTIAALGACESKQAELDHTDSAAVAKTMIVAARDLDLETLAYTYHSEHEYETRQALLAAIQEDVEPLNRFDPKEWDLFDPEEKLAQDVKAWNGYLEGPKYQDHYGDAVALYALSKPDQYNDHTIIVLSQYDEGWFVYDTWFLKADEFAALPDRIELVESE